MAPNSAPRVPSLNRDLAWIGGGILAAAALAGAAVGVIADVLWHRHKRVK